MSNQEELRRIVISAIHGMPYEEAIEEEMMFGCIVRDYENAPLSVIIAKESKPQRYLPDYAFSYIGDLTNGNFGRLNMKTCSFQEILGMPITIGRVLEAIQSITNDSGFITCYDGYEYAGIRLYPDGNIEVYNTDGQIDLIGWLLTKPDGQEAELSDQTEDTIEKLLQIFKAE